MNYKTSISGTLNIGQNLVNGTFKSFENPCAVAYVFGFNGQEKDDEITGTTGSHTTAQFWEYDTRIGRRWNLDPKPTVGLSDYSCFGNNPILYDDPFGDIWGKKGDKSSQEINQNEANTLKDNFKTQEKDLQGKLDDVTKQINNLGDKTSSDYTKLKGLQDEYSKGVTDMKNAQLEIDKMGADPNNYFVFSPLFGGTGYIEAEKIDNVQNTIYIHYTPDGGNSLESHEVKHGFQLTSGLMTKPAYKDGQTRTRSFYYAKGVTTLKLETEAYIRQHFTDVLNSDVHSYKEINKGYLMSKKRSDGTPLYPDIK